MDIIIEKATAADAAELLEHLKQVGGETDNLTFGAEGLPLSVEEEEAYLAGQEDSRDRVMLLAKENGRIVGSATLRRLTRRMSHRGEIGISIFRAYWNRGIGSRLMEGLITFAKENDFEIIDLQVRSDNAAAIHLYEKFGFRKLCTYPAFFKIAGEGVDVDYMCLRLR